MSENQTTELAELVTLPSKENALAVYSTVGGLDPIIQQIREKVSGTVYDTKTVKGRNECASDAFKIAKSKAAIEKLGKALSAEYKEIPKKIDAERRRAFDELDALQKEIRQPLTDWEDAEKARVDHHKRMIQHIKDCGLGMIGGEPQPYQILFRELEEKIVIDASWQEFEAEAHRVKAETLARLKTAFVEHQQREAEQAELAELRRKQAEQEKKDREARIAQEAADKAKRDAEAKAQAEREASAKREADAKAAQDKAERDRLEAIDRQKQAEDRAEAEKLAAEQRARDAAEAARLAEIKRQADEKAAAEAEEKAREANRAHKTKVLKAAKEAIMKSGVTEDQARAVVKMILDGQVPSVRISF